MASSKATTVAAYLKELPAERREIIAAVRDLVVRNLPKGYSESMNWGMIAYEIPLKVYPETYNGQPLIYAALAAQKNFYALYMLCGQDPKQTKWLANEFKKAGKKFDMGKSCLRFQALDDLPLDAIGTVIASTPPKQLIKYYEASRKKV